MLQGDRVVLRAVEESDRAALIAIRSTPEVVQWWGTADYDAEFTADLADDELHRYVIVRAGDAKATQVVGMVQFTEEDDPMYRHATIDIYIDPTVHRQGFATDALRTLIAHLFADRGHHRITIDPAAANVGAIACYAGIGFEPVGVLRQYERRDDGSFADGLLMDLVRLV